MNPSAVVSALSTELPETIASDLVHSFMEIRLDAATGTLGRTAPGKFVESFVQALQYISTGKFDAKPKVDAYLRNEESNASGVDDGLSVCAARVVRGMYTLRNKRNIAHIGGLDPNQTDLRYLLAAAQWALAEIVRYSTSLPMDEASDLIDAISAPVGGMVEDFGAKRLVHGTVTVREELLVVMHSYYPEPLTATELVDNLDRRSPGTVRKEVRKLWQARLAEGDGKNGYRLTSTGLANAIRVIRRETET